jgi:hypothetical protein
MRLKNLTKLAAAALLLAAGAASAQLGNGGSTYAGVDKGKPNPGQIVAQFVTTTQSLLAADAGMLAALGQKDAAAKAGAEGQNLAPDASRSALESALQVQADSGQALEKQLAAKAALSDADKQAFSSHAGALARGMLDYAAMARDTADMRKTMKASGGVASAALYAIKALPSSVKDLGQTLKSAQAYAAANAIELPAEVKQAVEQL